MTDSTTADLTENQIAWLRDWVGAQPDDDALTAVFNRQLDAGEADPLRATARAVLTRRLADYLAAPASFTTEEYGQNVGANITALQKQLGELADPGDPGSDQNAPWLLQRVELDVEDRHGSRAGDWPFWGGR